MPAITIRDVPDEARDELAARAARSGRSLQEFLRQHLIEVAARPDIADVVDRIQDRVDQTGTEISADDIIAWRDSERR